MLYQIPGLKEEVKAERVVTNFSMQVKENIASTSWIQKQTGVCICSFQQLRVFEEHAVDTKNVLDAILKITFASSVFIGKVPL